MSELLIDVTRLVGRLIKGRLATGIDRVCLAYVEKYGRSAQAILQKGPFGTVLSRGASQDLFGSILEPGRFFGLQSAAIISKSLILSSPAPTPQGAFVLNLGHTGPEAAGYCDWLRRKNLRPIFMVHDLIPVTHPEYCRPHEPARHGRRVHTMLRTAAAVITNSRATLHALSAFAAGRNVALPPACVAPLAAAPLPRSTGGRPLSGMYFVMLSTIEPRKNHDMILTVWRRLIEKHGTNAPQLVVIGQRGWQCDNTMNLLNYCADLRGFVTHRSRCSDIDLARYLRHAQALLFPSFVEGFGMPLIEALTLGVPGIASDLAVFREITGDIPNYLDPVDVHAWMNCVEAFCEPVSQRRNAQLGRMADFSPPTWSAHFEQFEQLLARAG
jgi:glycosyltransferase involved in cell wall biosynthesis